MPGVEQKAEQKPYWVQGEPERLVAQKIYREFDKYRNNRNRIFSNFRERNPIEYWNDSDRMFNNYREKPIWKQAWQANISDITTHSKLMAIVAMIVSNRLRPEFTPKFTRDLLARIKSQIYQNIYDWTDTVYRNGDMDNFFTTMMAAKRGTYIGFEGWKKTKNYEGVDACGVPLEDFYPQFINKFRMEDQDRVIWRTVAFKDDCDKVFGNNKNYVNYSKVRSKGALKPQDLTFFNVSGDIQEDQVEVLRWFNKEEDEFHITVSGVLITPLGSKLSARRKDGELGFWKTVYEPFDEDFFLGRSLPDLMYDNQEGIDFLFNAIFDQELLKTKTPLFTTAVNQLVDDYLEPGRLYTITDASNIFQPKLEGASQTAFQVLQELQSRQNFISTDAQNQGISQGRRTATEVERVAEAARKMSSLFTVLLQDGLQFKARLRIGTCMQYLLNKPTAKPIIMESTKLLNGKEGTRILEIVSKEKLSPKNQFGYSKPLAIKNAQYGYNGIPTEIIQFTPDEIKNFEYTVNVGVPSTVEMSKSLQKAYNERGGQIALARPDLWNNKEVAKILSEDWGWDSERVLASEEEAEPSPTEMAMMGAGGGTGKSPLERTPASPRPLKEVAGI
jgi:hypothetical protein